MEINTLVSILSSAPLVASVQAPPRTPLATPDHLLALAQASQAVGVKVFRFEGIANVQAAVDSLDAPVIGLIKDELPGSDVYITPTIHHVRQPVQTGCPVIATDATLRPRPNGENLAQVLEAIHDAGRLAMADCDSPESVLRAIELGFDILSTTLSGYTGSKIPQNPDLELVRFARRSTDKPVLAEGRYATPEQVACAIRAGATAVVVGGALNDPLKQTALLLPKPKPESVLAFDLGGTWLRWGLFDANLFLREKERVPLPANRSAILAEIARVGSKHPQATLAISSGGTIDPRSTEVWEAKPMVPDWQGTVLSEATPNRSVIALNDGLATAWGHSNHPDLVGKRLATLAIGTGVGAGLIAGHRIFCGPRGEYPRLNDLPLGTHTFEELLGGASLTKNPNADQIRDAINAATLAVQTIEAMWHPDAIVLAGGIGLADWLEPILNTGTTPILRSPFGADAGLYGAAALALFPPRFA